MILPLILAFGASAAAQSSSTIVCSAGQCLQGSSNTTIGVTASASSTNLLLLPGQYTSTTNPLLLHQVLTSSSLKLSPSTGFNSSTTALPLNVALSPGLSIYSQPLYSGSSGFTQLPSTPFLNSSTDLAASSLALSPNVWAAITSGPDRFVLWNSVPDISQLAIKGSLSLVDMQSSACSPPCASAGICTASGTCSCAPGFTGASCEVCSKGFFGPSCQPCPSGCTECDDSITGSGRCLNSLVPGAPATCNCLNGECGSNGQCSCNTGWETAANGTACAKCSAGFFLTDGGDCQVCAIGCTQCADSTGVCLTCKTGFSQNANDKTQCIPPKSPLPDNSLCPDGSFNSNGVCTPCSPSCATCSGGTSNDCTLCAPGTFSFNGGCVAADDNGICSGTGLIADNNKHECDTCGAKCTSCKIPGFNVASTISQLQCTGCLPGFALSNGKCLENCPSGSFLSPQDNTTCTACDSSCATCSGSSTTCLTCSGNLLASSGACVPTCPSNTFSSSGLCLPCHSDCASCSGSSFNQCSSCPPNRPVLTNGRCLPVCSQTQFFDRTSSTCQQCDASCSSCSGAGPSQCLACSGPGQIVKGGSCVTTTKCTTVIPGLGVCLEDLVSVPSGTAPAPLPTISTVPTVTGIPVVSRRPLEWWQILLMALGCAFIFLLILMLWRRRARKQRAKRTAKFAQAKNLEHKGSWRWRLVRFGEKLFGHHKSVRVEEESEEIKLAKMRNAEEARHHGEIEKLIGSYADGYSNRQSHHSQAPSMMSGPSMYSQVTGVPRKAPETRQPVKKELLLPSRLSNGSFFANPPTEAEAYAAEQRGASKGWLEVHRTGGSAKSNNPFR
ncbi:insulin-like growth factor binding protein [Mycena floridula]|nr:insulin-like growth factor binding protein [Mycena floridula]